MPDDEKKGIRFSMTVSPSWNPAFYDDFEAVGPYYRAGFVRSVIAQVYGPTPLANPLAAVPPSVDGGSLDDASADDAMMHAFGNELGLTTGSEQ